MDSVGKLRTGEKRRLSARKDLVSWFKTSDLRQSRQVLEVRSISRWLIALIDCSTSIADYHTGGRFERWRVGNFRGMHPPWRNTLWLILCFWHRCCWTEVFKIRGIPSKPTIWIMLSGQTLIISDKTDWICRWFHISEKTPFIMFCATFEQQIVLGTSYDQRVCLHEILCSLAKRKYKKRIPFCRELWANENCRMNDKVRETLSRALTLWKGKSFPGSYAQNI